jgi:hypothetical protein
VDCAMAGALTAVAAAARPAALRSFLRFMANLLSGSDENE